MADPILPGLILAGVLLPGRDGSVSGGGGPTPPSDGRWMFPMPAWRGYAPTQSDGYGLTKRDGRGHHGSDLMYRRKPGGADAMWPAGKIGGKANGTKHFFCPDGIYACAARAGTLWSVSKTGHGLAIVIDHGKPFATFYTHLSSVLFPLLQRGAGGIRVEAGQPIGVVGFSPLDAQKLLHLHFEIWYRGGSGSHVDPWPILASAPLPEGKS